MGDIRYYKGHSKKDGRNMIFKVYDEPQTDLFDDEEEHIWTVDASAIEKTGVKHYKNLIQCELDNYVSREITESEYECYVLIQHLLTEMFMHDYTGGFPRTQSVLNITRQLPSKVREWLGEIGFWKENNNVGLKGNRPKHRQRKNNQNN